MRFANKLSVSRSPLRKSAVMIGLVPVIMGALAFPVQAQDEEATGEWDFSGFAAMDLRVFPDSALHSGQRDQHLNPSLVLQPEVSYEWNDGDDRIDFIPFLRVDPQDSERRHADIRELKYLHIDDGWDLKVGVDKVFWGVTESRHLVDIINQTDAVEDVDGEDKLGQPMVNLGLQNEWGDVNFFVMPYFRERTFPGRKGRLRGSIPVDTDKAEYESDMEEFHPDLALRYATVLGDWDLGLAHFYGTSREPRLLARPDANGQITLIPRYDIINQSSVDVQATFDEWLWKLESIYRQGQGDDFFAVSGGVEYTFFGAIGDAGDLGLLAEYHYDGRDEDDAPATVFNDDIFVGARITLNDTADTDFLAGVVFDRLDHDKSFSIEANRRLDDHWTIEGELRLSDGISESSPIYDARRDDHLQVRLNYYF
ncbi:hypothetical protein O4H49_02105 [Kiloniella laminariae]|uniref:Porin domain-containing protein n=1 Tax=Kiloniella laminariae TaxID=454162 RepID=A0ABT4LHR7_9PROT|nr:hypothetical protein [Kiloniella laminariae]MCZ4279552.1 hypothetical protein [Kiloniella laminariae]